MSTLMTDERAAKVMADQHAHVQAIGAYYGDTSSQYVKASTSLLRAWASLLAHPGTDEVRVSRDDDLSLYVVAHFHYGIIWHAEHRQCTGCKARLDDQGRAGYVPGGGPGCGDGKHTPDLPYDAPVPGQWSMHS